MGFIFNNGLYYTQTGNIEESILHDTCPGWHWDLFEWIKKLEDRLHNPISGSCLKDSVETCEENIDRCRKLLDMKRRGRDKCPIHEYRGRIHEFLPRRDEFLDNGEAYLRFLYNELAEFKRKATWTEREGRVKKFKKLITYVEEERNAE